MMMMRQSAAAVIAGLFAGGALAQNWPDPTALLAAQRDAMDLRSKTRREFLNLKRLEG